jgi:voltage-gated potassium channel Kch
METVVLCSLGSVGTAVARQLYFRGIRTVVIAPKADDELHGETNPRCPVIAGEIFVERTLAPHAPRLDAAADRPEHGRLAISPHPSDS